VGSPERPVLRYFGGKWILAPWIISHFPPHRIYVEPYGGAGSVLIRKQRSYAEIYNDLDHEVVGLFRVLQNKETAADLERRLRLTPFSREEFDLAYVRTNEPIEQARRLIIRAYMGFGSDGHNQDSGKTGFRANSNRSGTTPAHDWSNFHEQIERFCGRLTGVVIENRDAKEVMLQQDSPETLHFVDPPYVHSTRGAKHSYKFEMSDKEHESLCDTLAALQGMVILCGYDNPIYTRLGWHTVRRESLADGARERTEVLWLNPACVAAQAQLSLLDTAAGGRDG
jgi:DNA adenine methylase